jgi:hypothetical protein
MLISAAVTGDEWTITSGAQGPAATFNTRTLTIKGSGSASHMVFANASASRILAVTNVSSGTMLTSGNTITLPVWRAEIAAGDVFMPSLSTQGETVAAPELFSIPNLQAVAAWYGPESTVTVSATKVLSWGNRVSAGSPLVHPGVTETPVHSSAAQNGLNALKFFNGGQFTRLRVAGSDPVATAVLSSANKNLSLTIVANVSSFGENNNIENSLLSIGHEDFNNSYLMIAVCGAAFVVSHNGATQQKRFKMGSAGSDWHIMRLVKTGSAGAFYVDGALVSSMDLSVDPFAQAVNHYSIGNRYAGGTSTYHNGYIGEIVIQATAMSSSQGRELDKLLGAKWGITIT